MDDSFFAMHVMFHVLRMVVHVQCFVLKIYQIIHDVPVLFHQMNMVKYLHVQHNQDLVLHKGYDLILDYQEMLQLQFVHAANRKVIFFPQLELCIFV